MMKLLADIPLGPQLVGPGPLGNGNPAAADQVFNSTLSKIIGILTVIAFIWFTFQVILGAIGIVSSGGDKGAVEKARKQITTGIVGVIIVVAAIFIVSLFGQILGIHDILNPTCIINNSC